MSQKTNIAWCDSTVNFWSGCTKVSPGCSNCYAAALANRAPKTFGKWGKGAPRQRHAGAVKAALALNRKPWVCDSCGLSYKNISEEKGGLEPIFCRCHHGNKFHRRRVFSLSLGDWLDDEVPIEWLAEMLDTIRQCDQVTWILCSKRWENFTLRMIQVALFAAGYRSGQKLDDECNPTHPANELLLRFVCEWSKEQNPPANIIGLCSVENQETADERIPQFLTVPLACRGLSMEPLLGQVDLSTSEKGDVIAPVDWLIIGGESGPGARPCNVNWIRSLVEQGKAAGVATFVKQTGSVCLVNPDEWAWTQNTPPIGTQFTWNDEQNSYVLFKKDKKGGNPAEWPVDLRVQQWPHGF